MARVKALPAAHSCRYYPDDYFKTLDWSQVFGKQGPVEIELGAGDGSFLIQYAQIHPDLCLLGIERLLGRIRKIDRNSHRARLNNVRLMRIEASYFLTYLPVDHSVQAVHVYFPDPWPKKRHHKNRIVNPDFVRQCLRILKPQGHVYLRTDHPEYYQQMLEVFGASGSFKQVDTTEALRAIRTDFETGFNAKGIPTQYASYQVRTEQ